MAVAVPFGARKTWSGCRVVVGTGPGNILTTVEFDPIGMIPILATLESETVPENPFRLVKVMFEDACPSAGMVRVSGLAWIVKDDVFPFE